MLAPVNPPSAGSPSVTATVRLSRGSYRGTTPRLGRFGERGRTPGVVRCECTEHGTDVQNDRGERSLDKPKT